jgi:hypothetical protein
MSAGVRIELYDRRHQRCHNIGRDQQRRYTQHDRSDHCSYANGVP